MADQPPSGPLSKMLTSLQAVQLLLAIGVFLWFGWEKEKLSAEQQRRDAKVQEQLLLSSADRERLARDLQMQTLASTKAQQDVFVQLITTARRAEQYAVGTEILKIISGQQECFTEDQYYVIEFLTDLFRKATTEIQVDAETFLSLARKRKTCVEVIPIGATAMSGLVVVGAPKPRCVNPRGADVGPNCQSIAVSEFTNFLVATGGDKVDAVGRLPKGTIVKAKRELNLRGNTTDIALGGNPIVGKIGDGQCGEVQESFPLIRGNTWARLYVRPCP